MKLFRVIVTLVLLCAAGAWAQTNPANQNTPKMGYLYPAGLQQGTTVKIACSGQFLRNPRDVIVSGEGVTARVVTFFRVPQYFKKEQRIWIQERLAYEQALRLAEFRGEPLPEDLALPAEPNGLPVPQHPLLVDLDGRSLRELAHIREILLTPRGKQQPNRQLAECVILEVTAAPDAAPGSRELRLVTRQGITNPMVLQVGRLSEMRELEPNNRQADMPLRGIPADAVPGLRVLSLPVVLNGQILPGDRDRFRFKANKGDPLVFKVQARTLIPYLADAVPGWFQAVVTLYDDQGKELAYADDDRFHPDPVLRYTVPKTGEYELEIRDAIYRGREDFVYRIEAGTSADVPSASPAVPEVWAGLDPVAEVPSQDVMEVNLPVVVKGCIESAGDQDVYRFAGRGGDPMVMDVTSRSLDTPLDSLVRLMDASGRVIAWNDDHVLKQAHLYKDPGGLLTHHADAYLVASLPGDGVYDVQISDAQHHGGPDYRYYLRIARAQGDFALRTAQSGLSVRAGGSVELTVHALRKEGFSDAIDLALVHPVFGFQLKDAQIPAGSDQATITLTAPRRGVFSQPFVLQLEGTAIINHQTVTRPVVPADDVMQAFLYRHLVPAKTLMVVVQNAPNRSRNNKAK